MNPSHQLHFVRILWVPVSVDFAQSTQGPLDDVVVVDDHLEFHSELDNGALESGDVVQVGHQHMALHDDILHFLLSVICRKDRWFFYRKK